MFGQKPLRIYEEFRHRNAFYKQKRVIPSGFIFPGLLFIFYISNNKLNSITWMHVRIYDMLFAWQPLNILIKCLSLLIKQIEKLI